MDIQDNSDQDNYQTYNYTNAPDQIDEIERSIHRITSVVMDYDKLYLCKVDNGYLLSYIEPKNENVVFNIKHIGLHIIKDKIRAKLLTVATYENNIYKGDFLNIVSSILDVIWANEKDIVAKHLSNLINSITLMRDNLISGDNSLIKAQYRLDV